MQYYPPPPCGYPNSAPSFPYSNNSPAAQVVGEGDVASVPLPGGGVQLYFVPRRPPCPPYGPWSPVEAWFIRSIPIPLPICQSTVFNQQVQKVMSEQSFQNIEARFDNKPEFQVKFHHDGATSTSDIHSFYPSLRCHNWYPKENVGTQAFSPLAAPPACSQPCHCTGTKFSRTHNTHTCACMEVDITCYCKESKSAKQKDCQNNNSTPLTSKNNKLKGCQSKSSSMSIEEHSAHKKTSKKIGKSEDIDCECPPEKTDKGCATVTERATTVEVGRAAQATCGPGAPVRRANSFLAQRAEVDYWYPKTPFSKKYLKSTDSKESCYCGCENGVDSD